MNTHLAIYLSGAAYLVRVAYRPGGKRFAVLDRTKRWRAAARQMRAHGAPDLAIRSALGCSQSALSRVTEWNFRF